MKTRTKTFRPRRWRAPILLAIGLAVGASCTDGDSSVSAEDRVYLRTESGQGESRIVGEVEDFTGVELVLRHRGGRQQTIPTARVLRVESDWSAPHQLARSKFQQHQYQASLDAYLQALRAEKRKWVQRQQLASITWCYRNLGKMGSAADAFLALYRNDPTTQHFAAIPLIWSGAVADIAVERRAATLLKDASQPAGQLIGASWLLTTSQRAAALETLRTLTNAKDARIIFLAEAQAWRTRQATFVAADVKRMEDRVQAMPEAIRAGPYFLLGTAQSRLGQPSRAALALLRIPINFPQDRALSAQALLAAGGELATINRTAEARSLYREIVVDYAETPAVTTAQQRFTALSQQGGGAATPDDAPQSPEN